MKLSGRGAIITGANQGLGQEIATHFVRAGASVLLVARGQERLQQVEEELTGAIAHPGQVIAGMAADVSRPDDCAAIAARARDELPALTILVNNAGVYGPLGPL